jgi:hypothetical protein
MNRRRHHSIFSRARYRRYLQSAAWRAKCFLVRQRSGGWCERCRARGRRSRASDVHHLTYVRLFDEHLTDLEHLCRDCHRRAHGRGGGALRKAAAWVILLGAVLWVIRLGALHGLGG